MSKNDAILDKVMKKIEKAYDTLTSKKYTKMFAESVADDVRKRVRLGYGVRANFASKEKLKDITEKTKIYRKRLRGKGELSEYTSPNRSNLTRSGQLTDSIIGLGQAKEFIVEVSDYRDDGKKNSDIVDAQEKQGRPFLYISNLEQKRLNSFVKSEILKLIRNK